jgi:hypothetical protein
VWKALFHHTSDAIVDVQPKLVLNNVDVLKRATCEDDTMVPAAMYHDSFIWRLIALGANEQCLPVFMSTSDG